MAHSDNRLAEASDDFETALRWNPGLELAYYHLALVWVDLDHTDEALRLLGQVRSRFEDSFTFEFYAGLVNLRAKDFDEAVARFTAAEGIARTNNPAALDREFYFQLGAACERDHQFPRAAQYLQKCIDMEPDDAEALNYLGFMWADQGEQLPKAAPASRKPSSWNPPTPPIWTAWAGCSTNSSCPRRRCPGCSKRCNSPPNRTPPSSTTWATFT
jgi:tetratricopeptide (TPR) repeat protein